MSDSVLLSGNVAERDAGQVPAFMELSFLWESQVIHACMVSLTCLTHLREKCYEENEDSSKNTVEGWMENS